MVPGRLRAWRRRVQRGRSALRLAGELDVAALQAAVDGLVARHEALRTTFGSRGRARVQFVHAAGGMCPVLRWGGGGAAAERGEAAAGGGRAAVRPAVGSAGAGVAGRESSRRHVLVLSMHHIVTDGWSMGVITRELSELYAAAVAGREPLLGVLPVQYGDYALWQREGLSGDALDQAVGYWRAAVGRVGAVGVAH